jgi:hypothetical protein
LLYLLDANVLIDANRDYYPIQRIPEFWEWLIHEGESAGVKIPIEIYEEIKDGKDDLGNWSRNHRTETALLLTQEVDQVLVARVIDEGYANDLTDDEVEKIGRDPFLIAYALVAPGQVCVVTTEVSKPARKRANRHLPDVCAELHVDCCNVSVHPPRGLAKEF